MLVLFVEVYVLLEVVVELKTLFNLVRVVYLFEDVFDWLGIEIIELIGVLFVVLKLLFWLLFVNK